MSVKDITSNDHSYRHNGSDIPFHDPMRAGINSLWAQQLFMDYKIKIQQQEFRVHKVVMASMSDYFKAMLSGGMTEGDKDSVLIEGVSPVVMETLILYIYTNHLDINQENAAEILGGAVYFQMGSAIWICTQFMTENLDAENWFDVMTLFKSYGLTEAVESVKRYVTRNITDVARADNTKLPYDEFRFVLDKWQSSEYDLFSFILKWVEGAKDERKQYADDLLCSVRFSLMTQRQLDELQNMKSYCGMSDSWDSLIDKALEYHKMPLHQRVLDYTDQSRVRSAPSFLMFSKHQEDKGCFYEPLRERRFIEHEGLRCSKKVGTAFREIVVNNFLIACVDSSRQNKLCIFDPRSLQWETMARIPGTSIGAILAHDKTHLYVVGGMQSQQILDSIYQYDFQTNTWHDFDRLPVPRRGFGACILDNGLYICGGIPGDYIAPNVDILAINFDEVDPSMYRLDLSSHQWEKKAPMEVLGYGHRMHVMSILGEEVMCYFDREYNMCYYRPGLDEWCNDSFYLSKPLPQVRIQTWVRGNSIFIADTDNERSEQNAYKVVTFPDDDDDEAVVEYMDGPGGDRMRTTALSIGPYTKEVVNQVFGAP